MDRPTLFSAQDLLEALLMPGFVDALNSVSPDDFDDFDGLRANLETQQTAFIAQAAPSVLEALDRYIDRQLAAPMVPAVRGEDYDPHRLAAIFLDPATSEDELRNASLYGDEADFDAIGAGPNLLAEYCHLLAGGDRAEALALLAVLVGDFDGWAQALAGEDLDTLQRDLKAQAESKRVRYIVKVRVPSGIWNDFRQEATLDVEVSTDFAEGETVAEAIRSCQLGSPLLEFESPEPWSGPAPVRQVAAEPARPRSFAPFGDPFADPRIDYADELADPLASGFSIASAIRAHEGTSFVPERRGIASIASNVRFLRKVRDYFMRYAETEKQQEVAAEEFERYRQGYVSHTNREQARRAQVRSMMIDGPAGFATRRNQAKSSAYEKAVEDSAAWSERAQKAAIRAIKEAGPYGDTSAPISSDDPEAVTKLKAKIEHLQKEQAAMLATNKIVRDKKLTREEKIAKMIAAGLNSRNATSALTPDFAGRLGFPSYALSNNTANIRRLEKRLEQLTRHRAESGGEITVDVAGIGEVRIVDSVEDNRLRLYFPGKPSYEVREKLKSNGFKWAPSEGAWQRMRGGNAEYAVKLVLGVSDLHRLLLASAQPEEEPEVIPIPVEDTLPEDEAAAELAAEEEMAEAEELAEELEPVRGDLDPYGNPKKSVDDRGVRPSEAQRALSAINEGMTLLRGWTRSRKGADDTEGQWNAVVRAIRGSEATAAAYFYDYAPKGIPAYADRRAWWRWNDANLSLPDDAPSIPFTGRLYYGEMPETAPAPEPPVREVAPGVTAYEFSRMQDDDAKRQAAASLVSQLSPRRAPVAEPEPAPASALPFRSAADLLNRLEAIGVINAQGKVDIAGIAQAARAERKAERERDIEAMLSKTFPPRKVKEVRLPELIDTFSGEVLVPARYGYVLEGSTGQTLADTAEEVEQKWDAIFAEKAEAERQRLLGLSDDSFKAERAYLLGFYYLIEDYLEETYPGDPERQAQAREILTEHTEQREGRKKTDKTFRGTRAEVADQMLKAGYFTIIQKPPGGSKEVPLLKNWQGVFEVKPEVFQFAEWLQERSKRDERASQEEAAEAERRFRTGNPRRRPNPDIGTSMVYGYGINTMTPSAPMGAASSVRSARLSAEAERLAQRLSRGRR